jgi:hypothetical protein
MGTPIISTIVVVLIVFDFAFADFAMVECQALTYPIFLPINGLSHFMTHSDTSESVA